MVATTTMPSQWAESLLAKLLMAREILSLVVLEGGNGAFRLDTLLCGEPASVAGMVAVKLQRWMVKCVFE